MYRNTRIRTLLKDQATDTCVEVVFCGDYYPADHGSLSGPPDNWREPSPAEYNATSVTGSGIELTMSSPQEEWDAFFARFGLEDPTAWMDVIDCGEWITAN